MLVWSLASGSSGNAYLVRHGDTAMLVECGLPLRKLIPYLHQRGVAPRSLAGILLTHEHGDHARSARYISRRFRVPLFASGGTLGGLGVREHACAGASLLNEVYPGRPFNVGAIEVLPFLVPHDAAQPLGYRLMSGDGIVCIATDLGFVPQTVVPHFRDADLLVLEANHDERMVQIGPYPGFLKRRVLGEHGHLSNAATGRALVACGDRVPQQVWLAHLSQVNNTPARAELDVMRHLSAAGLSHVQLRVARRNRPSLRWCSEPTAVQIQMF
jgi:phosphoribosyl 1,2-cyclic phosphodiesterase